MAKLLKLRRGTTTQHGSFTGAEGEVTIDTTKDTAVVHDGSTQGGRPLLREDVANLPDQSIQLNHLPHGTSSNNGKFLRANNGADPTFEVVNTDLVADTSPQLGGDLESNGNRVQMADNDQITLGTGNDLSIFHESSSNFNVFRQNNALSTKWLAGSDTVARFMTNDAVELYFDNARKLKTSTTGLQVGTTSSRLLIESVTSGDGSQDIARVGLNRDNGSTSDRQLWSQVTVSPTVSKFNIFARSANDTGTAGNYLAIDAVNNEFDLPRDNLKLRIGAGQDLQIYHDGGHSRIDEVGTGNLMIQSDNAVFIKKGTSENIALFNADADVQLMYDNSKKFETNSQGVEVIGHLQLDDSKYLKLGNSSGTQDVAIYHNGYNFHVQHTNAGSTYIDSVGDHNFRHSSTSEYRASFKNNGSVELYYDHSKKIQTQASGVDIFGYLNVGAGQSSSDIYMNDSDETTRRIHCNSARIGFLNSSNDWSAYSVNNGDWYVKGDLLPDGTHDIGSTGSRWQNIYTSDLSLSNEAIGGNDIDGTWGDWTIQEGESDLFLKNNRSGKQYKFNLTEVS